MSVLYSILPIDEELYQQLNEYLASFGVEIPIGITSRYPTPSEIRQGLDEMSEYTKRYFITEKVWDVDIYETAFYDEELHCANGKYATIYSMGPALNESLPLPIYFHGGTTELNLEIVVRFTRFTGPLLLWADFDAIPLLVSPGVKLPELLLQWRKNREIDDMDNATPSPGISFP